MTKEEKAIAFVEDFIKYGFRIDTTPTRIILQGEHGEGQHQEYTWWHEYVSGAEKRLREVARQVLIDG